MQAQSDIIDYFFLTEMAISWFLKRAVTKIMA